jgi:uncharacterized membrane protein YeaQ/YmgE (transglycosylase-associated protein family)
VANALAAVLYRCNVSSERSGSLSYLEHANMHMSGESLLVIVVVGVVAGWLAGQIVQGTGFGLVGDLVIGIAGAFIGAWLLPQLNVHIGVGIVAAIANATIGALILLIVIRAVRGSGRFGRRGWW